MYQLELVSFLTLGGDSPTYPLDHVYNTTSPSDKFFWNKRQQILHRILYVIFSNKKPYSSKDKLRGRKYTREPLLYQHRESLLPIAGRPTLRCELVVNFFSSL